MIRPSTDFDLWDESLRKALSVADLADFDRLWEVRAEAVEEPNRDRGGRSGVVRLDLPGLPGLYLKRQENFLTRNRRPPFARIPTVQREHEALRLLAREGLEAARPVYLGRRGPRAILMTEELVAEGDLAAILSGLGARARLDLARALGRELARFHALGLRHGALYPKHLLVLGRAPWRIGFIDLEKCRRRFPLERFALHDLDGLNRRSAAFGRGARFAFLEAYLGGRGPRFRRWWRRLAERARRRGMKG
ncbi:MAG: lipopolysaccharide kinase [Planctomycetes bacterium]|nr:lipopolysaccharide kinase [Planctomycetota bacterium]